MEYHGFEFLLKNGIASIDDPPQLHRKLVQDLKNFFKENADPQQAPFAFDPKKQRFDFFLKPALNHRRVIFNTASDPDNLIGEVYRDTGVQITRHTGTPPKWKTDLVFQLSTGNYLPRQSLVKYAGGNQTDGKKRPLALKPTAEKLIDLAIKPTLAFGLKSLVVAPKSFQEIPAVSEWADTEPDHDATKRA